MIGTEMRQFLILLALSGTAYADDIPSAKSFKQPLQCVTASGKEVILDPGRYIPEGMWVTHDGADKVLQEQAVQLAAENQSLRASAEKSGTSKWVILSVIAAGVIGLGLGTAL